VINCLFCKIANKEIPSEIVFENDDILAFNDINPQAPVHVLVIPKTHISSLNQIDQSNSETAVRILESVPDIAKKMGIFESGYRVVSNCGVDGMQSVDHLHIHILGKRLMKWPPG
jgi:histidine triad (HIT) family protein